MQSGILSTTINPTPRYTMVGVFVAQAADGVHVVVTGAGPCVLRVPEMEAALSSDFSSGAIAGISIPDGVLSSDIYSSAENRAHLVGVMAGRAVGAANG